MLRKESEEHANAGGHAQRLIAAMAHGDDGDAAVLDRASDTKERETRLEGDIEIWRKTCDDCSRVVADRQTDLGWARQNVERCASAVIASVDVLTLAKRVAEMQQSVNDAASALVFLSRQMPNDEQHRELAHILASVGVWRQEPARYPAYRAWEDSFKALQVDAEAPLPLPPID